MSFSNDRKEEFRRRWEQRMEKRSRHGHVWTGLFILLIGVAALIRVSNPDLPRYLFGWQTFLIGLGFFMGVKHGFRGGAWFILILIGGASLLTEIYPDLTIKQYIWPVALIAVGMLLIIRPRHRHRMQFQDSQKKKPGHDFSGRTGDDGTSQ
jgi:hypothetical protein